MTVVVERKVKQAVSEIGANARVRRPQAIKSYDCMNMYSVDS